MGNEVSMCWAISLVPGVHAVVAWPKSSSGSTSHHFRDCLNATEHKFYVNAIRDYF